MRDALTIAVLVAASLLIGACDGSGGNADGEPVATPKGTLAYTFRLEGPTTPNRTYYYAVGDAVDGTDPYVGCIVGTDSTFLVEGRPGQTYHIRNEPRMTRADLRMRWTLDARGTLGSKADANGGKIVTVTAGERSTIHVIAGPSAGGPDYVTLFDEETGTSACAVRDPRYGLVTAAWQGTAGTALREMAPPRPWLLSEFAPGPCVVAARTEGRQWMAVRADLTSGAKLDLDVGRQAEGGGAVTCEDPNAVLVLAGQFPVPAPRLTTDLQFRARWDGVPPGPHEIRYPDGRAVKLTVTDGETTKIGK